PDEYASGHLPGAASLPRGLIEKHIADIGRRDQSIVLYCQTGKRSALAADVLQTMGYPNVCHLAGGIDAWTKAGNAVERTARASAAGGEPAAVDYGDWNGIRADFGITGRLARCADGLDKPFVYLDHAASTHPPSTIIAAYARFLERDYANVHR